MKFFINYFTAFRFLGRGENNANAFGRAMFADIFEKILIAILLALLFTLESDLSFYYIDIALFAAAYAALGVQGLSERWCKYRISAMMPSNYKMRAAGEYFNGLIYIFLLFAYMCAIFCLCTIPNLLVGREQMLIDTNQNGVEIAFKISLLLWLAANGGISCKISSFGKRVIYDLVFVMISFGACILIKSASEGFTRFMILGDVSARFSTLPDAALWLVPAYTVSLAALAASVFITLRYKKPKDF